MRDSSLTKSHAPPTFHAVAIFNPTVTEEHQTISRIALSHEAKNVDKSILLLAHEPSQVKIPNPLGSASHGSHHWNVLTASRVELAFHDPLEKSDFFFLGCVWRFFSTPVLG